MTADETNLLTYMALMVVKIMARDLGTRAMKRTMGAIAYADRDTKHLQRLCLYIYKVDRKMGELALKVVAQNGPKAQEKEILKACRAALGEDFWTKHYGEGRSSKSSPKRSVEVQQIEEDVE